MIAFFTDKFSNNTLTINLFCVLNSAITRVMKALRVIALHRSTHHITHHPTVCGQIPAKILQTRTAHAFMCNLAAIIVWEYYILTLYLRLR